MVRSNNRTPIPSKETSPPNKEPPPNEESPPINNPPPNKPKSCMKKTSMPQ